MRLSRGAKRCLALLQDLSCGSMGEARPSRKWLAMRLDCPLRTLDRWTAELRVKGYLETKKCQHSAALYTVIQNCQNGKSGGKSDGSSERRYIGRVKVSGSEGVPVITKRIGPGSATHASPETERILEWAEAHGYPIESGADLELVIEAMTA